MDQLTEQEMETYIYWIVRMSLMETCDILWPAGPEVSTDYGIVKVK